MGAVDIILQKEKEERRRRRRRKRRKGKKKNMSTATPGRQTMQTQGGGRQGLDRSQGNKKDDCLLFCEGLRAQV